MEWYEASLRGDDDYDGAAYAHLLVRLIGIGLGLAVILANGSAV